MLEKLISRYKLSHSQNQTWSSKLFLTSKGVDETLICDDSNENYWAVLSCGTVYYDVQGGSNF